MAKKVCQRKAHFTFNWTIENGHVLHVSKTVFSPRFFVQPIENTKWRMSVATYLFSRLFIGIHREKDDGPDSIEIEFELSFVAADGSPLQVKTSRSRFKYEDKESLTFLEIDNKILFQRGAKFLPNDDLTVRCRMWRTGTEISKTDSCFARTLMGVDRRSFVWDIKEISSLEPGQKRTYFLNSNLNGSPRFNLSVFLSERNDKNYMNIQIKHNITNRKFWWLCKIALLDNDGQVVHSNENLNFGCVDDTYGYIFKEFFEKHELINKKSSLLQNDILYLKFDCLFETEPVWSRIENHGHLNLEDLEPIMTEIPEKNLDQPYESLTACCPFKRAFVDLYENESLSDVFLRAGAKSLPAHKNVLSVRSPVFEVMFKQDMREKTNKIVDIPDFNAETVGHLLQYIYTDTVEDIEWKCAMDLYRAADKYQLLDLRKKCSLILKLNISMTNVCSILSLADMHNDSNLRKTVENFISEHDNEVLISDEWKNFKEENLRLLLEIMERIMVNRRIY